MKPNGISPSKEVEKEIIAKQAKGKKSIFKPKEKKKNGKR